MNIGKLLGIIGIILMFTFLLVAARNYFSNEVIPRFIKFMNLAKIEYDVQVSKGIDIFGGCGQLSNSNKGAEEIC